MLPNKKQTAQQDMFQLKQKNQNNDSRSTNSFEKCSQMFFAFFVYYHESTITSQLSHIEIKSSNDEIVLV